MAAELTDIEGGVATVSLTGTLTARTLAHVQEAVADVIRTQGPIGILVLADQFTGWATGDSWDDVTFQLEFDPQIERMAIVTEWRWRSPALRFSAQALRPFPIKFFPPEDLDKAREWLSARP